MAGVKMLVTTPFQRDPERLGKIEHEHGMQFIVPTQGEPTAGAGLQTFAFTFVPGSDPAAGVVFLISSGADPTTVCIDNVALGTPN